MTTPTIEECLEAIYILQSEKIPVISVRLAERIRVSAPTMTETLKRMVGQGHVIVDSRKEIFLTEKGKEVAEAVVRRHRLSERWLTDVLGLDWAKAHQEACKLEHAISPEVEEKLSQALQNPSTCPHGNPIPGSGYVDIEGIVTLDRVTEGDEITIVRISQTGEDDPRFLEYLQRTGLTPGARLKVLEVAPWAGTITLDRDGNSVSVGVQAATSVWVLVEQPAQHKYKDYTIWIIDITDFANSREVLG